jgi:PII-like signaling protein
MTVWKQLTIYIGESDHWHHQSLYTALIEKARERGLAGATASRAIAGFGKHSTVHTTHLLDLSSDLPVVVTVIDREEALVEFLSVVKEMVKEGLVTMQTVEVLK